MGNQSQTAFSKEIGIHQSALSGYLNPKNDSRTPAKATDELIVGYLQSRCHPNWSIQELQSYLESPDTFGKFSAKLARKTKPLEKSNLQGLVQNLSDEEVIDLVVYIGDRLKKNTYLSA